MRHWRRAAALLLTLCMAASLLAGCGGDPNDEVKVSVVMTGGVTTVDPALATTPAERTAVLHLFDNLYRLTDEGAVSAAAQSCQQQDNEDGTQSYTFHLRADARWSDGTAVTAEDFVYAWRRLVSPETASPNASILSMVQGYEDAAPYEGIASAPYSSISSWAICTALVAAPLRTWSPQHQIFRPLSLVRSSRIRPTNTRSWSLVSSGMG